MKSNIFIYEYFKCDRDTGDGSYEKLLDAIKEVDDWENVKQYILRLKYFYYLKTSLWRIISEEIKCRTNWKCSCGCRENLQVHHTMILGQQFVLKQYGHTWNLIVQSGSV